MAAGVQMKDNDVAVCACLVHGSCCHTYHAHKHGTMRMSTYMQLHMYIHTEQKLCRYGTFTRLRVLGSCTCYAAPVLCGRNDLVT